MEDSEDTQTLVLYPKGEIGEEEQMDFEDQQPEYNSDEIRFKLFVKVVVENGEYFDDWVFSSTQEIPDEIIRNEFPAKRSVTVEFPFFDPQHIPRHTHVRAMSYWKNSEGERSDEKIIYYKAHSVDEKLQKMFVLSDKIDFDSERPSHSFGEDDKLKIELKKLHDRLVQEHIDIFAPEKEQELMHQKIRKTVNEFKRKYKKDIPVDEGRKRKEVSDPSQEERKISKIDQDIEQEESEQPDSVETEPCRVLELPLSQNVDGAFETMSIVCEFNIERILHSHYKDIWRHYDLFFKQKNKTEQTL
jgi:hypothetical protein